MKRTRLRLNWPNIAALAVTTMSFVVMTWWWLDIAADKACGVIL